MGETAERDKGTEGKLSRIRMVEEEAEFEGVSQNQWHPEMV